MKVLILGARGYIGNSLMGYLKHDLLGIDNGIRDNLVTLVGSKSLTDIEEFGECETLDVTDYIALEDKIRTFKPDAIIHLAEQPSAPYSMKSAATAGWTQYNNIVGTLNLLWAVKEVDPSIHIIKLGTAGEYPDWLYEGIEVPEDTRIDVKYNGRDWTIPTPRYAGSWYHFSKLHDSYNIDYACRIWGLNVTDINQGIVYGHREGTRFDYDQYFGTVVNRFAVQKALGFPLTVYGTGEQMRGFIHIDNVMQAIELILENPPKGYRIIHQLTEALTVKEIAEMFDHKISYQNNPRAELKQNKIKFEAKTLKSFGLKPIKMRDKISDIVSLAEENKDKIRAEVILPTTTWK